MRVGFGALIAVGIVAVCSPAEAAQICAPRKITASGAPSNLTFFARSRAKAAWITKVTRDPRLGPGYAQWLKAREGRIICRKVDTQQICIAAALPCRNAGTAAPQPKSTATLRPL